MAGWQAGRQTVKQAGSVHKGELTTLCLCRSEHILYTHEHIIPLHIHFLQLQKEKEKEKR